jgi:hypothetical protein
LKFPKKVIMCIVVIVAQWQHLLALIFFKTIESRI